MKIVSYHTVMLFLLTTFIAGCGESGCESVFASVSLDVESIAITPAEDSTTVTLDISCRVSEGETDENLCKDWKECVTVYWLPTLKNEALDQNQLEAQAITSGKSCSTFSKTPQTLTVTVLSEGDTNAAKQIHVYLKTNSLSAAQIELQPNAEQEE